MFHKLTFALLALLISTTAQAAAIKSKSAPASALKPASALPQLTLSPTYLDGLTNEKYTTGSNAFGTLLKKDGSEEMRAYLRMNSGVAKAAHMSSLNPQNLHLSLTHVANKKATETQRLNFKGLRKSEVGTRVLTFESKAAKADGRFVAKVQQELTSKENIWKTTGTMVQFVPAGSSL